MVGNTKRGAGEGSATASSLHIEEKANNTVHTVTRIVLGWAIDRSVTPIYSSVGNTLRFDGVLVTGSNLTANIPFTETLARAHLKTKNTSPWIPRK